MATTKMTGKTKCIVTRRRDGDMNGVYSCVKGTDGEVVSTIVPLDKEVILDDNTILSLKGRTEMVRVKSTQGGERLVAKPTFLIEKV